MSLIEIIKDFVRTKEDETGIVDKSLKEGEIDLIAFEELGDGKGDDE